MCTCACVRMCLCGCTCACACVCVHVVCTHVCPCLCARVCVGVCAHMCLCARVCLCICAHVHVLVSMCMCPPPPPLLGSLKPHALARWSKVDFVFESRLDLQKHHTSCPGQDALAVSTWRQGSISVAMAEPTLVH